MTALGLASIASDDAELAPCVSTVSHSGQQKWVKRSENVRDRQNRQCLCCGRIERLYGRVRHYRDLEIHHVRWQQHGGTGKTFDWQEAAPAFRILNEHLRVVVAGGLTAENVGNAIEILKPWGVDVASGVETLPGKKDPQKVRAFVKAVRDADRKAS